jgi:bifunctional pyridoxal-dependent enzyme with beta-cystathionase and maltose regulon repressor activities
VLLGRPCYVGFISDIANRAKAKPVLVSFGDVDPLSIEAVDAYEHALTNASSNGTPIRALLLCHPHNPLGRCYSKDVVEAYLQLCGKYGIHFIW